MDGVISRRMMIFLRYGGTDGEDEDAGNENRRCKHFLGLHHVMTNKRSASII